MAMPTTASMQHPDHPWLLGAGDAIRFDGEGLPRLGVFAVRQAPVLARKIPLNHSDAVQPPGPMSTPLLASANH